MRQSLKKSITHQEYLQIIGLLTISAQRQRDLRIIEESLIELTGECDDAGKPRKVWDGGHCGDQVCSISPDADELLAKFGLHVLPVRRRPK